MRSMGDQTRSVHAYWESVYTNAYLRALEISLTSTLDDEPINLIFSIRGVIIAELYVNRIHGAS